ncbi:MAG TPA: VOC family protein [Acidimicrobiia bacterium]|nr:VOC family protein [Acidimicrobiia bacterium]
MEQRLSLVTLGVTDLELSRRFYRAIGWEESGQSTEDVVFFQAGDIVVGLWDRESLAEDSTVADSGGWGGITLAYNTRTRDAVDEVIEEARSAGATIGREPADTFWGGYSGVFIDPDGHPWEIAHNPDWQMGEDGSVRLP